MTQATRGADLIVTAGPDAALAARAAECSRRARRLDPGDAPDGLPGTSLIPAVAALFTTEDYCTDLTPFLGPARPTILQGAR